MLIILGGTVRITGSGMGCPDWPKCYGRLIPPTQASQLSAQYDKATFNPLKTWIEYINRTFTGVVSIVAVAMLITSFSWWSADKVFAAMAISVIVLIGFEAWLGAVVVKTNLNNYKITFHLVAAMFIFAISIAGVVRSLKYSYPSVQMPTLINVLMALTLLILVIQIILGTFVRTEVDLIAQSYDGSHRELWIDQAQTWFPSHRQFAYVAGLLIAALVFMIFRIQAGDVFIKGSAVVLLVATCGQIMTGLALKDFDFPAAAQLIHLVLSMTMFGALIFALAWNIIRIKKQEPEPLRVVDFAK